jgi:predicted dehydrogenase
LTYRAAIIGCGRIAHASDLSSTEGEVYTHAKAYASHSETQLAAVCDIQPHVAEGCARTWGTEAFSDARSMLRDSRPDIISICTPDATHAEMLELCLEYPIRAVWCEKPLATTGQNVGPLVREYERRGILLAVNYIRRWDPEISRIGEAIRSGSLGKIQKAIAYYSKGFMHSGSHFLDLFLSWFGEAESWKVLDSFLDTFDEDPTLDVNISFASGANAYLIGLRDQCFSMDEIDLYGEKARVRIAAYSTAVEWYWPAVDVKTGIRILPTTADTKRTGLSTLMLRILDNLVRAIDAKESLLSTGRTALLTWRLCEKIQSTAQSLPLKERVNA